MARQMIAISVFVALTMFLLSGTAIATLSKTYYTAFVNPHTFDGLLKDELVNNQNYYDQLEFCSQVAPQALAKLENQLRQQYSVCPNNARCTQLAKDIKTVMDLRIKTRDLMKFIGAKRSNTQLRFLDSNIGHTAIFLYDFHKNMGIDIRNNPTFIQEIGILDSIPCQ